MASPADKWTADKYQQNAHFVYSSALTAPILGLLNPQNGEHILDLGCGSGELSIDIANSIQHGSLLGYDSAPDMIAKANVQSKGGVKSSTNIAFQLQDGHSFGSDQGNSAFDAVFSNAALHWMKEDPKKVIDNCYKVLKKNGRFVGEFGGHLNMIGVRSAIHSAMNARGFDASSLDPWYFPTPEAYKSLLESANFRVDHCELAPRITPLPTGIAGWLETFAFPFLAVLKTAKEKQEIIEEICKNLEVDLKDPVTGNWTAMYVRLRFRAYKQ